MMLQRHSEILQVGKGYDNCHDKLTNLCLWEKKKKIIYELDHKIVKNRFLMKIHTHEIIKYITVIE